MYKSFAELRKIYESQEKPLHVLILEREIEVRSLVNLPYHYVIIALMTENSELIQVGLLFSINLEKDYILPNDQWLLGIWKDIRVSLEKYIEISRIEANKGKHNLKSSWYNDNGFY